MIESHNPPDKLPSGAAASGLRLKGTQGQTRTRAGFRGWMCSLAEGKTARSYISPYLVKRVRGRFRHVPGHADPAGVAHL